MIDTSDLEWYMEVDVDRMTVAELGGLMGCLGTGETAHYSIGLNKRDDNVYLYYDMGTITLRLDAIYGSDMENVLTKIKDHNGRIIEIGHSVPHNPFYQVYHAYGPQFFDEYTTWEVWKETSGFNAFVMEVYDDE